MPVGGATGVGDSGQLRRERRWPVDERVGCDIRSTKNGRRRHAFVVRAVELVLIVSSSLAPLVAMVKSADARQRDDFRRGGWPRHNRPSIWGIFVQSEVAAVCVIVADIGSDKPHKMVPAEDDDVFQ